MEILLDAAPVVIEGPGRHRLPLGDVVFLPEVVDFLAGEGAVAGDCVDDPDVFVDELFHGERNFENFAECLRLCLSECFAAKRY